MESDNLDIYNIILSKESQFVSEEEDIDDNFLENNEYFQTHQQNMPLEVCGRLKMS